MLEKLLKIRQLEKSYLVYYVNDFRVAINKLGLEDYFYMMICDICEQIFDIWIKENNLVIENIQSNLTFR